VEAGAPDDDVGLVLDAAAVDDTVGDDFGDAVGVEEVGLSFLGRTRAGVRWKTVSSPTSWAMIGMNWIALAPVPMTTTFLSLRSIRWSQVAVWNIGPSNVSAP
jgi:hypothetical protein